MEVLVSVGGKNVRMQGELRSDFQGNPKYLLPIEYTGRNGKKYETILDWIIHTASCPFILHCGEHNFQSLTQFAEKHIKAEIVVDHFLSGPLGPLIRNVLDSQSQSYGCAGDFFHKEFQWNNFLQFHHSHSLPVSILLSKSCPTKDGASFHTASNGQITGWERLDRTTNTHLINIGAYIIDYTEELGTLLRTLQSHKEDPFFSLLIEHKLLAGYVLEGEGFNVNTISTYNHLKKHLLS